MNLVNMIVYESLQPVLATKKNYLHIGGGG